VTAVVGSDGGDGGPALTIDVERPVARLDFQAGIQARRP
jgi:hypothetical protein